MPDYEKIVDRFQKNLDYEIKQPSLVFVLKHYMNGDMTDEDCIELSGYYKGLKVAREILQRVIACEQEESGEFDE